jgi:hypothetical protein
MILGLYAIRMLSHENTVLTIGKTVSDSQANHCPAGDQGRYLISFQHF